MNPTSAIQERRRLRRPCRRRLKGPFFWDRIIPGRVLDHLKVIFAGNLTSDRTVERIIYNESGHLSKRAGLNHINLNNDPADPIPDST